MAEKPHVLVIEDDPDQAFMYQIEFEAHGLDVTSIYSGINAVEKTRELRPNIILLDLIMEDKKGIEILRELKEDKELAKIPVIVFTNFGKLSLQKEAEELGAVKFIKKTERLPRQIVSDIKQILSIP